MTKSSLTPAVTSFSASRSTSAAGGAARCTASSTLSYCCGPVTANTPGCTEVIFSGSAPMQPVTMTLPFSAMAAPMAESDSAGAVEEAAGIDDGEVGAGMVARQLVALGAQPGDDALGIDQCLRAAERNEGNAGWSGAVHRGFIAWCRRVATRALLQ